MKETFEKPVVEIVHIDTDVICTSSTNNNNNNNELPTIFV